MKVPSSSRLTVALGKIARVRQPSSFLVTCIVRAFTWDPVLFKTGSNMPAEAWRDIIKFLVPLYNNKSTPSKFNSSKKAKDKLATFDKEYGSSWDALMEVQLKNFQAKQIQNRIKLEMQLSILKHSYILKRTLSAATVVVKVMAMRDAFDFI